MPTSVNTSSKELSKLRWQCRRGVKELDVVLGDYLNNHYSQADEKEQKIFQKILRVEDPLLLACLMEDKPLKDPQQTALFKKLKTLI